MKTSFACLLIFLSAIAGRADTSIIVSNKYSMLAGQAVQSAYTNGSLVWPVYSYDILFTTFLIGGNPPPISPPSFAAGTGFIFNKLSSTSIAVTLPDPTSPVLPPQLPAGFSIICCQSNVPATFEMMVGRPPTPGTKIFRLLATGIPNQPLPQNDTNYAMYTFNGDSWSPAPPVADIGESVWVFQPPVISNLQTTNGTITFGALTGRGTQTVVEWSDSLTGTWQTLTNFPFTSGNLTNVTDSVAPDVPTQRFYRVNVVETRHFSPGLR
jgi:hypothetical protein